LLSAWSNENGKWTVGTGAFCVADSLWFTLVELPKVKAVTRPIYQEMGLLPARDLELISNVQEPAI